MTRTLRRFATLRPGDVADIARAYGHLVRAGWRLFVARDTGSRWLRECTGEADRLPAPEENAWVERAARWTNSAARRPLPWARCLQRSMALCMWMESRGLTPTLRLGVRKEGHGIDAHSWVEFNGRIVNDDDSVSAVFSSFLNRGAVSAGITDCDDGRHATGRNR